MSHVRIIIGSQSDMAHAEKAKEQLNFFGISNDLFVSSAHRTPERTKELCIKAEDDGVKVIIAMAGMAAHLPGVVASFTTLPVIGVPLSGSPLNGVDSLYAVVQMPTGIPVATVAIDGAKNAAILAAQIIAVSNLDIKVKLMKMREEYYK